MSFWAQPLWLQSHTVRVAQRWRCVYLCTEKDLPLFHTALSSLCNHKQWEKNILLIFKVWERGYNWTCDQPAGENAGFVVLLNIVFVVRRAPPNTNISLLTFPSSLIWFQQSSPKFMCIQENTCMCGENSVTLHKISINLLQQLFFLNKCY